MTDKQSMDNCVVETIQNLFKYVLPGFFYFQSIPNVEKLTKKLIRISPIFQIT